MPRLPTTSDFPNLTVTVTPNPEAGQSTTSSSSSSSSSSPPPANVLVLLHGLGDTEAPFTNLGRQLNLPATCVVSVQAPNPLPFDLPGYHWGDDISLDPAGGGGAALDPDAGFNVATRVLLHKVVAQGLVQACGFAPRRVLLWGFGQGGMTALTVGAAAEPASMTMTTEVDGAQASASSSTTTSTSTSTSTSTTPASTAVGELGGIISVGGPLPEDVSARTAKGERKCRTPVLILGGSSGTLVTDGQVDRLKRVFDFVQRVKWRRSGDGMPRDRSEMTPIMQFLARRLLASTPEGAVEIG